MATSININATPSRLTPLPLLTPGRCSAPGPVSVVEAVQSAVQNIPDVQLHPTGSRTNKLVFPPKALLAVLTYCYATDTFSAVEIGNRYRTNPACRSAGGSDFPEANELRAFRQSNRTVIEKCLVTVLRHVEHQKAESHLSAPPMEEWIADDARRRILLAACCDSMELDDDGFSW